MRGIRYNKNAVSEVVGYSIALSITAVLITGVFFITNTAKDQKIELSASVLARNVANQVADGVLDALTVKQNSPDADYSRKIEIPTTLAGLNYYIQATNNYIYVNTTNGRVTAKSSLYNIPSYANMGVNDKIWGSAGDIVINISKSEYEYKFDFGPAVSSSPWLRNNGYTRVSENQIPPSISTKWNNEYNDFKHCTCIKLSNPAEDETPINYVILVRLDPSNFDYSLIETNDGSDIRFVDGNGVSLSYWIERWKPWNTSTSRIWVKIDNRIPADSTYRIYMFHGKPDATDESDGGDTFLFFDNFTSNEQTQTKWDIPVEGSVEKGYLILDSLTSNAIATVKGSVYTFEEGILEVKAKAAGEIGNNRDASVFARQIGDDPNIQRRYVFHSGGYTGGTSPYRLFNLSISIYDDSDPTGHDQKPMVGLMTNPAVDYEWNRLVYILNGHDYVGARYNYDDFSLDAYVNWSEETDTYPLGTPGIFGLMNQRGTIGQNGGKSYFDWIFLRPYFGRTITAEDVEASAQGSITTQSQYPTAEIGDTWSKNYHWNNIVNLNSNSYSDVSDDLSRDFVYNSVGINSFCVYNLTYPDIKYSVVYIVGDKCYESCENPDDFTMSIEANEIHNIDIDSGEYVSGWFTIEPDDLDSDGTNDDIQFRFFSNSHYWNICAITIEKGIRVVSLEES